LSINVFQTHFRKIFLSHIIYLLISFMIFNMHGSKVQSYFKKNDKDIVNLWGRRRYKCYI